MESKVLEKIKSLCHMELLPLETSLRQFFYVTDSGDTYKTGFNKSINIENGQKFFDEDEYLWVSSLELRIEASSSPILLKALDNTGEEKTISSAFRIKDGNCENILFDVNILTKSIELHIPFSSVGSVNFIKVVEVKIIGFNYSNNVNLVKDIEYLWKEIDRNSLEEIELLDDKIAQKRREFDAVAKDVELANSNLQELHKTYKLTQEQLNSSRQYLNDDRDELNSIKSFIEQEKKNVNTLNAKVIDLSQEHEALTKAVGENKIELHSLLNSIEKYKKEAKVYSEDFSAYKKEVNYQQLVYFILLIVTSTLMYIVVSRIYDSAYELVVNYKPDVDLWKLIVIRMPLVSINLAVIGILSSLLYYSIGVIKSNFEKMASIKQIAYLVKECVESQTVDSDLNDDQLIKLRIKNKMELIREYIKS